MDEMSESNGAQDYDDQQAPAPAPAQGGGYEICIRVKPDGTFSIYKEDAPAQPGEGMPAPGGESGDSVSDFKDALRAALQIYKENPVDGSDQSSFDAGFSGKSPMS